MSDDTVEMPAQAEDPNHPEQRAKQAMLGIYKLGMLHAAFLLRGTDCQEVSNEQLDWCADFIEREADEREAMAPWPARRKSDIRKPAPFHGNVYEP